MTHSVSIGRARPALAADDHPVDPVQIDRAQIFEQGLDRQEPGWRPAPAAKSSIARQAVSAILDAHAPPDLLSEGRFRSWSATCSRSRSDRLVNTW